MLEPEHTIQSSDASLPELTLSGGAFPQWDDRYQYDIEECPAAIEPVEHQLRLDARQAGAMRSLLQQQALLDSFNPYQVDPDSDPDPWTGKRARKPLVVRYMEETCQSCIGAEKRFFDNVDADAVIQEAPEYLEYELRRAREADDPQAELDQVRGDRIDWYEETIPYRTIYAMCTKNSIGGLINFRGEEFRAGNTYIGAVVIDGKTDCGVFAREYNIDRDWVYTLNQAISNYDADTCHPSDYGIELPAPLVIGEFSSGSNYLLIPWGDCLVCSCPFKQRHPWRVMCKHEFFTALAMGFEDDQLIPLDQGVEVPARSRRFLSPDAVANRDRKQLR
jgi:hypothetical protein